MSKRQLSQHQQQRIEQRREGALHHKTAQQGLVVMNSGKKALVRLKDDTIHQCHQRANLANVVAGDNVMVWQNEQGESVIESLLPRRSLLSRPGFRGVIKPVAANVDQLLVVIAPTPGIDLDLLDRSLCYCEWQALDAIIILNKADLIHENYRDYCNTLAETYRSMGYTWIETSTKNQQGMTDLLAICHNKTSVFLGNSGVGKSSLTQALVPDITIRTQSLSSSTGLGQHTTNNATLYDLPFGGQLIDAAGIRTLELSEFSIAQPDRYWRDFQPFLGQCRFHNCTHSHEPGCAIQLAVAQNKIPLHRHQHYLRLLQDTNTLNKS
ncbi:MAG: ribosome small subunit-dependent GTPase A [Thiotrichales bacterium]|jgi:ribosome biogenesis GTPase|nr:ribosome small subunit-dependent GTPase A [Thiotrichales bacterium]